MTPTAPPTSHELYNAVAVETASVVIGRYSTSFAMATRLLSPEIRPDIRVVYALVRIADEIVDGVAAAAGLPNDEVVAALDALETETHHAMQTGYSTNLVVHAFALTARSAGITTELTTPFFASMRADCSTATHDPESFDAYVFGSAEVVGLMCLRVFLRGHSRSVAEHAALDEGARRLGAAFQKINFLRDLSADHLALGRSYFPDVDVDHFREADKHTILADISADLDAAAAMLPLLPSSSRRAVALAHSLFHELARRISRTPASDLITTRVRVPDPVKARLTLVAALGGGWNR